MLYETVQIWDKHPEATLTSYVLTSDDELRYPPLPTVLVCPGGGYSYLSSREAEPIAIQFLKEGYNVFVLMYSVGAGAADYTPAIEVALAIKYIRDNAEKYNVDPDRLFTCGFSAGGHLAASSGVFWKHPAVRAELGDCPVDIARPTATILSYPVITGGEFAHKNSICRLAGRADKSELTEEDIYKFSLENHVDTDTPPAFLWHTFEDQVVPVQNSLMYASALREKNVPFELHIFPKGPHGLALSNDLTGANVKPVPHCACWVELAVKWLRDFFG